MKFAIDNGIFAATLQGVPVLRLSRDDGSITIGLTGWDKLVAPATGVLFGGRSALERECCAGCLSVNDSLVEFSPSILRVERIWTNTGDCAMAFSPAFEFQTCFLPTSYMIPSVSYNGNHAGGGKEPKGLGLNGQPWFYSYERTSLPGATFSENNQFCAGLMAAACDMDSLKCACSLDRQGDFFIHSLAWPPRETPLTYSDTDEYGPAVVRELELQPGCSFKTTFFIYAAAIDVPRTGWFKAYDEALALYPLDTSMRFSSDKAWQLGIRYLKQQLWVDDGKFTGFSIGLLPGGVHSRGQQSKQWKQRLARKYEIGWAGQNFSNALLMICDFIYHGNAESLDMGERCISRWCETARASNGLFHVMYDDVLDGRENPVLDTCNLGWGALQAMNAWSVCQSIGREHADWLDMGIRCCDFFVDAWKRHGTFGTAWRLDGNLVERGATAGAFMLPALIKAYRLTGKEEYLRTATEAFAHYSRDLDAMACAGGALDTCCIDAETAWSLFGPALDLYEITGGKEYLSEAVKAAYYTLSWVFHFNIPADTGSDFEQHGFKSAGASGVSTQHHHLHYGALYYVSDWIRLGRITGDERWIKRARLVWGGSLNAISDGALSVHGMVRPEGSENEAFMQCNWGTGENGGVKHYMNDWLVVWPCTFRLLNLTGCNRADVRQALDGCRAPAAAGSSSRPNTDFNRFAARICYAVLR